MSDVLSREEVERLADLYEGVASGFRPLAASHEALREQSKRIRELEAEEMWSCSHDGFHPKNRADWCEWGCGNDYNRMTKRVMSKEVAGGVTRLAEAKGAHMAAHARSEAEVERLRKLLREERDARVPRLVNEALGESDE